MSVSTSGVAWERQRAALRREIVETAVRLFTENGFEATTVDQIAAAVGISRRSFFRYFGTKEDVLLSDLLARGEAIARALASRPVEEDAWTALLLAMNDARAEQRSDAAQDLAIGRMMLQTPSLRARHIEKRLAWQTMLVPPLSRHVRAGNAELAATAIVATALACLDVATEAFVRADGTTPLDDLYFDALDAAVPAKPRVASALRHRRAEE
ncbi:TetR/AcrR family transcriptional regulator [Puerhibacterium puerhi]|uniref:TetR/AcrR family transcriptional regulator n=1 Tax=Puerhibacterium puerhi TaxID=2692623 RepID=UPI001915B7A3|nr:TetR/AcrR family transcriptional regulator [Puerhibacterium puerhi]